VLTGTRLTTSFALLALFFLLQTEAATAQQTFAISPYLQLGEAPDSRNLLICFAVAGKGNYKLEFKQANSRNFQEGKASEEAMYGRPELRYFSCRLSGMKQDKEIAYRIFRDGGVVYEGSAGAFPSAGRDLKIALVGNLSFSKGKANRLLSCLSGQAPGLLMLTGDLAYPWATVDQYLENFFPAFNMAGGAAGSLLSRVLVAACPGDRDLSADRYDAQHDNRDLDAAPGGLAYFYFWKQPLNGPGKPDGKNIPVARGAPAKVQDFLSSAGRAYPASANYSFDWGDSHWLVLDGGPYVDWRDSDWRRFVHDDLSVSKKRWKFVVFHQPGFTADTNHGEEQRLRLLADLFEQGGVDLVFSGHSNSYQRSCPLHFSVSGQPDSDSESRLGFVYGKFRLDRNFDGVKSRRPDGVIYVVSGGGGAEPCAEFRIQDDETRWQPFTRKFYCASQSFTFMELHGKELVLKQIADDGKIVDSIKIVK
jgi:acid phosphatase type 7